MFFLADSSYQRLSHRAGLDRLTCDIVKALFPKGEGPAAVSEPIQTILAKNTTAYDSATQPQQRFELTNINWQVSACGPCLAHGSFRRKATSVAHAARNRFLHDAPGQKHVYLEERVLKDAGSFKV